MDQGLAAETQGGHAARFGLRTGGVGDVEPGHVQTRQLGHRRRSDQGQTCVQHRLPRQLGAELGGEINATKQQRLDGGCGGGDFARRRQPARALDQGDERDAGQPARQQHQLLGAFGLGQHHEGGCGLRFVQGQHIAQRVGAGQAVDAHAVAVTLGLGAQEVHHGYTCGHAIGRRHGVFKVDADKVSTRGPGFGVPLGPIAGHEEQRTHVGQHHKLPLAGEGLRSGLNASANASATRCACTRVPSDPLRGAVAPKGQAQRINAFPRRPRRSSTPR